MEIKTNGQRNITLDFNAPKKFRLLKDGQEIPYLRTGKNSFRLGRNIDGVLDLEEIIEQPKIVKPIQLQAQQMALVNPNDVLMINQAAQQLEVEQNLLSETQKRVEQTQNYLDVQQKIINESVETVSALESDNAQRITATENGIFNLAGNLASTEQNLIDSIGIVNNSLQEHKSAENPHGITKKTIGLDKVDNTSDLDKPISKAVQNALDEKADKDEIQAIRDELGEYQEKNDRFTNALSNYTGGLAGNQLPDGGLAGQILAKRSDMSGDAEWVDRSASITVDDELSLESENPVQNKIITSSVIIKSDNFPTASEDLEGAIYQYVGETGTYTHGYIYECQEKTTYDARILIEPNKFVFDDTRGNLIDFFAEITPDYLQIATGIFEYDLAGDIWHISGKDSEENTLFSNYNLYTEDLEDYGFVFIVPMSEISDGEQISYTLTYYSTTTYEWVRIDVQPNNAVWGQITGDYHNQTDINNAFTGEATARQNADNNLQAQINNLKDRGRFLSLWNCATGLATTNPPESPYEYKSGDYFIVGAVSESTPAVNYRPDGSSYTTGVASSTVETEEVNIDDTYFYDGTNWKLQSNTQKTLTFANIAGDPYDNEALSDAFDLTLRTKGTAGTNSFVDTRAGTASYPTTGSNLTNSMIIGKGAYVIPSSALSGVTIYGANAYAYNSNSVSIGNSSNSAAYSVAVGTSASATSSYTTSLGFNARATNLNSVAVGYSSNASNSYATVIGAAASSSYQHSTSLGYGSTSTGSSSVEIGAYAKAANYSVAIGRDAIASNSYTVQLGQGTNSSYGSLQFRNWQLVNNEGKIPEERLPESIKTATPKVPNLYKIDQSKVTEQSILYTGTTNDSISNSMFYRGRLREGHPTFNCSWVDNEWIDSYQDVYIDQQKLFTKLAEVSLERVNNDDIENSLIGGDNAEQSIYLYYDADNDNYFIRFDSDSFESAFNHTPDDITGLSFDDFADYGIYINNFHKPEDVEGEYEFCDIYYYAPIYCDSYEWNNNPSYIDYFRLMNGMNDSDWGIGRVIPSYNTWEYEVDGTTYNCPIIPETYEYGGSEYDNIEFRWEWNSTDWKQYINGEYTGYEWTTAEMYTSFGIKIEQGEEENIEYINLKLRGAVQRYWEQFNPIDDSIYALASQLEPIKEWSVQTITGTKNLDDYKTEGWYKFVGSSITNKPNNVNSPILMLVIKADNVNVKQFIFAPNVTSSIGTSGYTRYAPSIFHRMYLGGTWSSWNTILNNDSANFLNNYNANVKQKLIHNPNSPTLNWVADTTVNDSTITFTQGGVSKGSFTLNQSTGATIELDAGSTIQKITATNPALTSSSGICTWTISNTLGADVEVMIKKVSNNESVMFDYIPTSSTITVKLYSTSNISANTYKAVIVG